MLDEVTCPDDGSDKPANEVTLDDYRPKVNVV
jgi:hypothetical protein